MHTSLCPLHGVPCRVRHIGNCKIPPIWGILQYGRDGVTAAGKRNRVRTSDKAKEAPKEALDAMNESMAKLLAFTEHLRQRHEAQPTAPARTLEDDHALREELVAADEERTERMLRARNETVADRLEPKTADEIMREFVRRHPADAD